MSPPAWGPVSSFSEVVLGGWSSYETSECQRSRLGKGSECGEEVLYTTDWGKEFIRSSGELGWKRTVGLFQAWLFRDRCRRVFVKRSPVTGEVQLLVNIEVLISEDLRPSCSGDTEIQDFDGYLQTTPLSAASSDLATQHESPEGRETTRKTYNSSFCAPDNRCRSMP